MLNWNEKVIKYLDNAEEYNSFAKNILNVIESYLKDKKNALEIGCGVGNMSILFSYLYENVTCIDISELVIEHLKTKLKKFNIKNVNPMILSSNETFSEKYDLIFASFFFNQDDFLRLIKNNLTKNGVAIYIFRKNYKHSIENNKIEKNIKYYELFEKKLKNENILYKRIETTFDKSQPLIDENDAKNFFELYGNNLNMDKLIYINDKKYKFLYKIERETYIYILNKLCEN